MRTLLLVPLILLSYGCTSLVVNYRQDSSIQKHSKNRIFVIRNINQTKEDNNYALIRQKIIDKLHKEGWSYAETANQDTTHMLYFTFTSDFNRRQVNATGSKSAQDGLSDGIDYMIRIEIKPMQSPPAAQEFYSATITTEKTKLSQRVVIGKMLDAIFQDFPGTNFVWFLKRM
jgi:hypothetical protein